MQQLNLNVYNIITMLYVSYKYIFGLRNVHTKLKKSIE